MGHALCIFRSVRTSNIRMGESRGGNPDPVAPDRWSRDLQEALTSQFRRELVEVCRHHASRTRPPGYDATVGALMVTALLKSWRLMTACAVRCASEPAGICRDWPFEPVPSAKAGERPCRSAVTSAS